MSELAVVALLIGLLALAGGAAALFSPRAVQAGMAAWPRSVWPGRILAAVDLAWAAWELSQMHLGMFDAWKMHLWWLAPVAIGLCVVYLDELLSVRALGGLLLLAAGPMLDAARWHPSDWRLVIAVLSYLWILAGLTFLLSPWWFRRIALRVQSEKLMRAGGALKALAGAGLLLLAFLVY